MTKVAYITSGKIGIPRFTYNELHELNKHDIAFILCLTQLNEGPWMPNEDWKTIVASKFKFTFSLLNQLLKKPQKTLSQLNYARKKKVLSYYFISLSLFHDLKHDEDLSSIHCQMGDKKLYIGYFLKQLLKLPLTVTVHAHELYQRDIYDDNKTLRQLYSHCDSVITISNYNAEIIKKYLIEPSQPVEVMRLFPVLDYQKKVFAKTRILIVANWAEKKGYKILLKTISKLNRDDFVLWVVGDSYFSENSIDLNKLIIEYDVADKVAILGRQGGIILDIIFSACDIFCLPSYTEFFPDGKPAEKEGIPVALMEAMAWGKPVISTKHAGIPELVEHILIDEKNESQLKDALISLLDNPEMRTELGKRNAEIVAELYTNNNVKKLADQFKKWG